MTLPSTISVDASANPKTQEIANFLEHPELFHTLPDCVPPVVEFLKGVKDGHITRTHIAHRYYFSSLDRLENLAKTINERKAELSLTSLAFSQNEEIQKILSALESLTEAEKFLAEYFYLGLCIKHSLGGGTIILNLHDQDRPPDFMLRKKYNKVLKRLNSASYFFYKAQNTPLHYKSTSTIDSDFENHRRRERYFLEQGAKKDDPFCLLKLASRFLDDPNRTSDDELLLAYSYLERASHLGSTHAAYRLYTERFNLGYNADSLIELIHQILITYRDTNFLLCLLIKNKYFLKKSATSTPSHSQKIERLEKLQAQLPHLNFEEEIAKLYNDLYLLSKPEDELRPFYKQQVLEYCKKADDKFGISEKSQFLRIILYATKNDQEHLISEVKNYLVMMLKGNNVDYNIPISEHIRKMITNHAENYTDRDLLLRIYTMIIANKSEQIYNFRPMKLISDLTKEDDLKCFHYLYDSILPPELKNKIVYDIIEQITSILTEKLEHFNSIHIREIEEIIKHTGLISEQMKQMTPESLAEISDDERKDIVIQISKLLREFEHETNQHLDQAMRQEALNSFLEDLPLPKGKKSLIAKKNIKSPNKVAKKARKPLRQASSKATILSIPTASQDMKPIAVIPAEIAPRSISKSPPNKKSSQPTYDLQKYKRLEKETQRISRVLQELQDLDLKTKTYIVEKASQDKKTKLAIDELFDPKAKYNSILSFKMMKHIVIKIGGQQENLGGADGFKLTLPPHVYTAHNSSDLDKPKHGGAVSAFKHFLISVYKSNRL